MPKVVTSKTVTDFVATGAHETIKAGEKPADMKPETPPPEPIPAAQKEAAEAKANGKDEPKDEEAQPEGEKERPKAKQSFRQRAYEILEKPEAKELAAAFYDAQESFEESERFAEGQYNRARIAESKLADAEKLLAELQKPAQVPKESELKEPDENDAKYRDDKGNFKFKEFTKDMSDFAATKAVSEDRAKRAEEDAKRQQTELEQAHFKRVQAFREVTPDYDEVASAAPKTNIPGYLVNYMVRSEHGAQFGYHFAKNPDVLDAIVKLDPIMAVAKMGRLETQFETKAKAPEGATQKPPAAQKSGAPPPIAPISGSSATAVQKQPHEMNFRELRAYERERAREKRTRH